MAAAEQPRFLFWLVAAFIIIFAFYNVAMLILPRLVIFNQLPETVDLYVDNADVLATRVAYGMCALWQSRSSFKTGFESTSQYKSTSGSVGQNEIIAKLADTECKDIVWQYKGGTIIAGKNTYDVIISLKSGATLIEVEVKQK
ncbi:MAG: hypothetical protein HY051_06450 [Candidatus Aenigmarchaeota archaeon]|nr:hypothetical protein [Candidatus Aenigmarchaeota archaeon]